MEKLGKKVLLVFSKALDKKIIFPLDRKSVSTSPSEEFVKKYFFT